MTHDEYCISICGGKCCKVWVDTIQVGQCKLQLPDGRCSIRDQWIGDSCKQTKETTGHEIAADIFEALRLRVLPDWVEAQCCYAHEELLEER